jgi:hypothetical protein
MEILIQDGFLKKPVFFFFFFKKRNNYHDYALN